MSALIMSLALAEVLSQGSKAPMVRYGGRDSYSIDHLVLRKQFARQRYDPPNPQYIEDGSIGFTDNPDVFAVFDKTYRPWRSLLAKRQLIDLLMNNDPRQSFELSQLPEALHDEIMLHIDLEHPSYVVNLKTRITFMANLDTKIHLKDSTINLTQGTSLPKSPQATDAAKELVLFPAFYSDIHPQEIRDREIIYSRIPIINVFGPIDDGPVNFEIRQKMALKLFEDWSQAENFRIDQKFFEYLERANVWSDKAAIFRCKVMRELSVISPSAYQSIMNELTKNYEASGFTNEDAMREALTSAQTISSTSFECTVAQRRMDKPAGAMTFKFP